MLSFDWSQVGVDIANAFDVEAKEAAQRTVKPKTKAVPEDDARKALYDAARANPFAYKVDYYQREAMVHLIVKGLPIDEAYAEVSE